MAKPKWAESKVFIDPTPEEELELDKVIAQRATECREKHFLEMKQEIDNPDKLQKKRTWSIRTFKYSYADRIFKELR